MIGASFSDSFRWDELIFGCNMSKMPPSTARTGPFLVLILAVDASSRRLAPGKANDYPVRNSLCLLPHETDVHTTPGSGDEFVVVAYASSRGVPNTQTPALCDLGFLSPPMAIPAVGEEVGEGPAEGIEAEVEEEAPAPPAVARLSLQEQAVSLEHLLTHEPTNEHCQACRSAKARHRPHRRKHLVSERATRFGELVAAGHVYAHSEALEGCDGALDMLVVF